MQSEESIIRNLTSGAESLACSRFLQKISPLDRCRIMTEAGYDRMQRKHAKIMEIYEESNKSWDQTFYKVLLRSLDIGANRKPYEALADALPYRVLLRERNSSLQLEALLLGMSGLLVLCKDDEYSARLRSEFAFLKSKHSLRPLPPSAWRLSGITPYNHPVLRLSQVATLIQNMPFITNSILECRSTSDVERLFRVQASAYWTAALFPTLPDPEHTFHIGTEKCYMLGINLVAQLQYAYGLHIGNNTLTESSISLLETLPAENNTYTRRWAKHGVKAGNAFESQALLQIITEYCAHRRCGECHIARFIINSERTNSHRWEDTAEGFDD